MTASSLLLLSLLAAAAAAAPEEADLAGTWRAGPRTLFEVSRSGAELWAVDQGSRRVIHGRVEGGQVKAGWVDLGTSPFATGTLVLESRGAGRLAVVEASDPSLHGEWAKLVVPAGAVRLSWSDSLSALGEVSCASVWCLPGLGGPGAVWGTEVYTGDSSICAAAVHSGLFPMAEGGQATLRVLAGQQAYQGSDQHGVSSRPWNAWATSFTFAKKCDPSQPRPGARMDQAISATGATTAAGTWARKGLVWYSCPPEVLASTVWGTDLYSDDSSVCGAAIHAGAIRAKAGGLVGVERRGPQPGLQGSVRNGVESRSYGAWPRTFQVVQELPAERP